MLIKDLKDNTIQSQTCKLKSYRKKFVFAYSPLLIELKGRFHGHTASFIHCDFSPSLTDNTRSFLGILGILRTTLFILQMNAPHYHDIYVHNSHAIYFFPRVTFLRWMKSRIHIYLHSNVSSEMFDDIFHLCKQLRV